MLGNDRRLKPQSPALVTHLLQQGPAGPAVMARIFLRWRDNFPLARVLVAGSAGACSVDRSSSFPSMHFSRSVEREPESVPLSHRSELFSFVTALYPRSFHLTLDM